MYALVCRINSGKEVFCVRVLINEIDIYRLGKVDLLISTELRFLQQKIWQHLSESFTAAIFVLETATAPVNVGILLLMELNVKNKWPLIQFFTCGKVQEIKRSFVIVILKVTSNQLPKGQVQVGFWIGNWFLHLSRTR